MSKDLYRDLAMNARMRTPTPREWSELQRVKQPSSYAEAIAFFFKYHSHEDPGMGQEQNAAKAVASAHEWELDGGVIRCPANTENTIGWKIHSARSSIGTF